MSSFISKTEIIKGSKAAGISIRIKPDDELEINTVVICRSGNKLSVYNKIVYTQTEEISKTIPVNLPVYLSIDGKGVLHKITDSQYDESLIDLVLPDATSKDFVIQAISINEKRRIISVMRKNRLEEILNKLNKSGYDVLKIFLGPFSISSIVQFFEDNSTIFLPYYNLVLKNNSVEGFEKTLKSSTDFNIDVESNILDSGFIVPFSNCIHHFVENAGLSNDYTEINYQKDNYRFKRLFRLCGWGMIMFFFTSLLMNFLVFDHYREKNRLLLAQAGSNKEILNKIERTKRLIKTKEDFLKENPYRNNLLFAYYSDRLAKEVPSGITLERLSLFPLQKQLKNKEEFCFLNGKILISGYSHSSNYLDLWITSLKNLKWIKEIVIRNYFDNGTGSAGFVLEIDLKELNK